MAGYTYLSYRQTVQTGTIFGILPNYAASKIDINEARGQVNQLIWGYIFQILGLVVLYSAQLGFGQVLAALYTRRQSVAIARLLLDDDENQYTLYHASPLKLLPNIISHDLAEFNVQIFYLLIGSIYYNGVIGKSERNQYFIVILFSFTLRRSREVYSLYSSSRSTKWQREGCSHCLLLSTLHLCAHFMCNSAALSCQREVRE